MGLGQLGLAFRIRVEGDNGLVIGIIVIPKVINITHAFTLR